VFQVCILLPVCCRDTFPRMPEYMLLHVCPHHVARNYLKKAGKMEGVMSRCQLQVGEKAAGVQIRSLQI